MLNKYEVVFEYGSVLSVVAEDKPDVEDKLFEMGFDSRQIAKASIEQQKEKGESECPM